MNQILNGMMEAGAMGRGIKLDKIQKQLIDACYANQYVVARKMTGHNIYSMRKGIQIFLCGTFMPTYFNSVIFLLVRVLVYYFVVEVAERKVFFRFQYQLTRKLLPPKQISGKSIMSQNKLSSHS